MIPQAPVPQAQAMPQMANPPVQQVRPQPQVPQAPAKPKAQAILISKKQDNGKDELMLGIIMAAQQVYEPPQVQPGAGNPAMQLKPGWGGQNK